MHLDPVCPGIHGAPGPCGKAIGNLMDLLYRQGAGGAEGDLLPRTVNATDLLFIVIIRVK